MSDNSNQLRYEIPDIVYGTWRIMDESEKLSDAALAGASRVCLEHGIGTIDTAEIYGLYQVEAAIGGALKSGPGAERAIADHYQSWYRCSFGRKVRSVVTALQRDKRELGCLRGKIAELDEHRCHRSISSPSTGLADFTGRYNCRS